MNAEMALRPAGAVAYRPIAGNRNEASQTFFMVGAPRDTAINVVFTRIVNDYSTVHGTTAACPMRGGPCEPVNLGS